MSKTGQTGPEAGASGADMPFETALEKLESIVEAMESDELPLETMLARFEEGVRLSETCRGKLAAAELKIQQLEKTTSGELELKAMPLPDNGSNE